MALWLTTVIFIIIFQISAYEGSACTSATTESRSTLSHPNECAVNSAQLLKSVFVKNVGWASQVSW